MTDEIEPTAQHALTREHSASDNPRPDLETRFSKGMSGNPGGRPRGSHNKSTMLARSILETAAGALTDKTVAVALEGHPLALRLCMERVFPRPRDAMIDIGLPAIASAQDCGQAFNAILAAVAAGEITPAHAETLTNLVEKRLQSFKIVEFEQRLSAIEQAIATKSHAGGVRL